MAWSRRWSSAWVGAATRWNRGERLQALRRATPRLRRALHPRHPPGRALGEERDVARGAARPAPRRGPLRAALRHDGPRGGGRALARRMGGAPMPRARGAPARRAAGIRHRARPAAGAVPLRRPRRRGGAALGPREPGAGSPGPCARAVHAQPAAPGASRKAPGTTPGVRSGGGEPMPFLRSRNHLERMDSTRSSHSYCVFPVLSAR